MRQPHKMVKHTQTIRRQQPANCLSVFVHFVGLALKGLSRRVNNPMKSRFFVYFAEWRLSNLCNNSLHNSFLFDF